jgi:molybdate transport system substrate-binding protein
VRPRRFRDGAQPSDSLIWTSFDRMSSRGLFDGSHLSVKAVSALACLTLFVAACGSSSKSTGSSPTSGAGSTKLSGSLNVFAASSLTEAFNDEKTTLASSEPWLKLTYDFAGSQALVAQIQSGAPADVFASADQENMQELVTAGLVEAPKTFTRNKLEIAVAAGNPEQITDLADLEKPGVVLVLEDPSVPAGNYARQAFRQAGLPAPKPASNEVDVKSTLAKLTSGDADAVVVYVTDVKAAGSKVEGVEIPDAQNVIATYPIAVIKASKNASAAEAFVDEIVSGTGQQALQARGFLAPS